MVSLGELLNLKDKLAIVLHSCLEHRGTCPAMETKGGGESSTSSSGDQDLYFVFSKDARNEMLNILTKMNAMLTNIRPMGPPQASAPAPPPAPVQPPQPAADTSRVDLSTVPKINIPGLNLNGLSLTQLEKLVQTKPPRKNAKQPKKQKTRIGKEVAVEDPKQTNLAAGYWMGTDPKPKLDDVAKKFNIPKTEWIASCLLDMGVDLSLSYHLKNYRILMRYKQRSTKPPPKAFHKLSPERREQLTQEANQWIHSGPHRLHVEKPERVKSKGVGSGRAARNNPIEFTDEQKKDMLDFYEAHYQEVTYPWIVEQFIEKYRACDNTVGRVVIIGLLEKDGKDLDESKEQERKNKKYAKLLAQKEAIFSYVRRTNPEDLCVTQIRSMFNLSCDVHKISDFLKDNGFVVMTVNQKRAKRLADLGLPYTPAVDPEKSREYSERYKETRKARRAKGGSSAGSQTKLKRSTTKKEGKTKGQKTRSPAKPAAEPAPEQWDMACEVDEAIAQLSADVVGVGQPHQYGIRTRQTATNANQYYHYY